MLRVLQAKVVHRSHQTHLGVGNHDQFEGSITARCSNFSTESFACSYATFRTVRKGAAIARSVLVARVGTGHHREDNLFRPADRSRSRKFLPLHCRF